MMTNTNILLKPTAMAAMIATGTISFLPNLLLFLLPQVQYKSSSPSTSRWLIVGQAFGAGGLVGDVFLHTLPESIIENTGSNNHPKQVGIFIVLGFTFFFMVDLFVRSVNETHHHHHNHHNQNHNHSHPTDTITTKRSIILLNLVADSLHNYTDGLAIGASYCSSSSIALMNHQTPKMSYMNTIRSILQSHTRGGMATISICLHEIPHELSDYCTLVRAGYTTRQAILIQFVTAIAAFAGTITAILIIAAQQQQNDENQYYEQRLLWMTAGGFLYLAGTTILPEVLNYEHDIEENNNKSSKKTSRLYSRSIHFIAFCIGLGMMGVVDWISGDDHHHHHHHHHHHSHDNHELHETGVQHDHDHHHHHEHSEL